MPKTVVEPLPELLSRYGKPVDALDVLSYLDDLRDSGKTNMFSAGPFIRKEFKLREDDSFKILGYWARHFKNG